MRYVVVSNKGLSYPEAHKFEIHSTGALVFLNEAGEIQLAFAPGTWNSIRREELKVDAKAA